MSDALDSYIQRFDDDHNAMVVVQKHLHKASGQATDLVQLEGVLQSPIGPFIRKKVGYSKSQEFIFKNLQRACQNLSPWDIHLSRVLDVYKDDWYLYAIFDYIEGQSLDQLDPQVLIENADWIVQDVLSGLDFLHSMRPAIIHRDIKPENIIVDIDKKKACIIDLGIARGYKEKSRHDTVFMGSEAWCPPEQYGFGQTTNKSDIYSTGLLVYWIYTHKIPDHSIREDGFVLDSPELSTFIARAASFDPDKRFASVKEMQDEWQKLSSKHKLMQPKSIEANASQSLRLSAFINFLKTHNMSWFLHLYNYCILGFDLLWSLVCISSLFVQENSNFINRALILLCIWPFMLIFSAGLIWREPFVRSVPHFAHISSKQKWIEILGALSIIILFTIILASAYSALQLFL